MAYVWVNTWEHARTYDKVTFKFSFNVSSSSVWNNDGQAISVWGSVSGSWTHYGQLSQYAREWTQDTGAGCPGMGSRRSVEAHISTWDKGGGSWPNWGNQVDSYAQTYWNPAFDTSKLALSTGTSSSRNITYSNLDVPQSERLSYQKPDGTYSQTADASKSGTLNLIGFSANTKMMINVGMVPRGSSGPFICNGSREFAVYPTYSALTYPTITPLKVSGTSAKINWSAGFANKGNAPFVSTVGFRNYGNSNNLQSYNDDLTVAGSRTFTGLAVNTRYHVRTELEYTYHDSTVYNPGVTSIIYPEYTEVTVPRVTVNRKEGTPSTLIVQWAAALNNNANLLNHSVEIIAARQDNGELIASRTVSMLQAGSTELINMPYDTKIDLVAQLTVNYYDGNSYVEFSNLVEIDYACNAFIKVNGEWRRGTRVLVKDNGVWKPMQGLVKYKVSGVWR